MKFKKIGLILVLLSTMLLASCGNQDTKATQSVATNATAAENEMQSSANKSVVDTTTTTAQTPVDSESQAEINSNSAINSDISEATDGISDDNIVTPELTTGALHPDDAAIEAPFFSIEEHEYNGASWYFAVCDDCYKDVFSNANYINVIAYGYDENNNEVLGSKFFSDYSLAFYTDIADFEIPGKHIIGLVPPDDLAEANLDKVVYAAAVDGIEEPVGFYLLLMDNENTWYYKLDAYIG